MQYLSVKGFLNAALSSSTFGLAPFFTITLLMTGVSSFEVLAYRWGIASLALAIFGVILGEKFRITRKDWSMVFILSLFRIVGVRKSRAVNIPSTEKKIRS